MIKGKPTIVANPNAMKLLNRISDADTKMFGEAALIFAREVCPFDVGDLQASLRYEHEDGQKTGLLKARTEYAGAVHFGTTKMAARPFLAWGVDKAVPKITAIIAARPDYRG